MKKPNLLKRLANLIGRCFKRANKKQAIPEEVTAQEDQTMHNHNDGLVPYDEDLLERARTQWQFGDWESLIKIERETLQHHPDRAKLALLAAAGHLQQGDNNTARQFTRLALDWGCSKKLVSQILIAGVHNSLGRASAINGDGQRALQHFESAIAAGVPAGEIRLYTKARFGEQLEQLGLAENTLDHSPISNNVGLQKASDPTTDAENEDYLLLKDIGISLNEIDLRKSGIPKQDLVDAQFDLDENNLTENILVIFSTPRCGSSYLCNLLRTNSLCIPHEYFQLEQYLPILSKRWGCTSDRLID